MSQKLKNKLDSTLAQMESEVGTEETAPDFSRRSLFDVCMAIYELLCKILAKGA